MKIGDRVKLRELVDGQVWDNGTIVGTHQGRSASYFRVRWLNEDGTDLTTSTELPEDLEVVAQ